MSAILQIVEIPVNRIRDTLAHLPLLADLPADLREDIALRVHTFRAPADTVLYTPERVTPWVNYLFILIRGHGRQYGVAPDLIPWPERRLGPGAVFGRHTTLLSMPPEITVEVAGGSLLYAVEIEDLAYIVGRWPQLYDRLIPLDHMRRLRAMPALAPFGDDHIRRLCDHVQVVTLPQDAPLPSRPDPTLWMVVQGQLAPIPHSPYPVATTGRAVVVEPDTPMSPPIRALQPTTLFALPLALWAGLMRHADPEGTLSPTLLAFPDLPAYLQRTPPFHRLPPTIQARLAGYTAWIFTPAGQTLFHAGDPEHALYVLVDGLATWRTSQDEGRVQEGTLHPGQAVGMDGLLHGHRAPFSLTAARPSLWLRLSRDDLDRAHKDGLSCAEGEPGRPSLWHCLEGTPPRRPPGNGPTEWLEEGERLLWMDRQHVLFFLLRVLPWITLASLAIPLLPTLPAGATRQAAAVGLVLLALWCAYLVIDYLNDFYALTDRRLVHRDRLWGIREHRQEIPLDQIQDATFNQDLLGRLFNYGTIIIASAAHHGAMVMRHIPHPAHTLKHILDARRDARRTLRGRNHQILEEHIMRHIHPHLEAAWPTTTTGTQEREGSRTPANPTPLIRAIRPLMERGTEPHLPWSPITFWQEGDTLYWRKHPLNLFLRAWRPALTLTILILAPLLLHSQAPFLQTPHHPGLFLAWSLLITAAAAWLLWEYDDWRNDLYILTSDQIVDVEKRPLFAQENRRTAPLSRVQTVQMDMRSPLAHLFNYGDVIVRTAAEAGDLTFHFVPEPRHVVQTIEAYREAWHRRQQEKEFLHQARAMLRAMEIHDSLGSDKPRARSRTWTADL